MRKLLIAGLGLVLLGLARQASPAPPDETAAPLKALKDENRQVRLRAVRDLGNLGTAGKSAVPALSAAMKNDIHPHVRIQAALALAQIGPPAVPALIEALADEEPWVRAQAAHALGTIGSPARDAVPALTQALKDPQANVRSKAAFALGEIGPDAGAAAPELAQALQDTESDVSAQAAIALIKVGPAAVTPLERALSAENSRVR